MLWNKAYVVVEEEWRDDGSFIRHKIRGVFRTLDGALRFANKGYDHHKPGRRTWEVLKLPLGEEIDSVWDFMY